MCWQTLRCQRGHKMHLNMCWPSHASGDTKCMLTWVNQNLPCQWGQIKRFYIFWANPFLSFRGHNIYLKLCWPNPSHGSEDTKYISTCVDQNYPITPRAESVYQYLLTKPLPWQWGYKMYLNFCWPNPITARTPNASQLVKTKSHLCQRGLKI